MSVGTTAAILIGAGIAATGAVTSSVIGAHAAGKAADQQAASATNALDFQKATYADEQANQAPFLAAGQTSIGKLMDNLNNGTFGPGSQAPFAAPSSTVGNPDFAPPPSTVGNPNFAPPPSTVGNPNFVAPTAAEAAATPGYQFTFDQGQRGVSASAAARGGALSGGAVKEAIQYGTGLADSTYNTRFGQALAGYQTNLANQGQQFGESLAGYNANLQNQGQQFGESLAGYSTNLQNQQQQYNQALGTWQSNQQQQQQQYNQLYNTAALGEASVNSLNNSGQQSATNVGNLMTQVGNAQAAGTVGTANAIGGGINGATGSIANGLLLSRLFGAGSTPGYSSAIGNGGAPIPSNYGVDGFPLYGG